VDVQIANGGGGEEALDQRLNPIALDDVGVVHHGRGIEGAPGEQARSQRGRHFVRLEMDVSRILAHVDGMAGPLRVRHGEVLVVEQEQPFAVAQAHAARIARPRVGNAPDDLADRELGLVEQEESLELRERQTRDSK
jgi:hypothetical protein